MTNDPNPGPRTPVPAFRRRIERVLTVGHMGPQAFARYLDALVEARSAVRRGLSDEHLEAVGMKLEYFEKGC